MKTTTLGMGCFWCSEAIYQQLDGVTKITSGYSGTTGHAEVIQLEFDPEIISFDEILDVFWKLHDPTTLNRQGADIGSQYRSVIFYHDKKQKQIAERSKNEAKKLYDRPIVTEITPFANFYPAEKYHQNFYQNNRNAPYCRLVIDPKLEKLAFEKF